ncbi:DUF805 domain-containing protein [Robiginitalea sp. M366]|uniref:DUF805 domain-containing protein n=1 Tax=Robiginitalea aestuariiviva TaxID=3036903 RepID=UPI00240D8D48|nr:DUF805 domain-containing protein [Robiginitalea aestuariiviva]MDG1572009.1 DUF805 domain-containing protein [Robiginitalea aestuariiviva]
MFTSLFSFSGRIRRLEFGLSYILYWFLTMTLSVLMDYLEMGAVLVVVPLLLNIYVLLAQGSKRCHDLGNSGFYQLIPFYIFVMLFQEGQKGKNRYGADPKANQESMTEAETNNIPYKNVLFYTLPAALLSGFCLLLLGWMGDEDDGLMMFFGIVICNTVCVFLMLLLNGFRSGSFRDRKIIIAQFLVSGILLVLLIVVFSYFVRGVSYGLDDFWSLLALQIVLLGSALVAYVTYVVIFQDRRPGVQRPKYHLFASGLLLFGILILGFVEAGEPAALSEVKWSERPITWDDFQTREALSEEFVATIYSGISTPDQISDTSAWVYAFMSPQLSQKLKGEYDSFNVLQHEQFHFHITEYMARNMRKTFLGLGPGKVTPDRIDSLELLFHARLDSLQDVYDSITDHNADYEQQRKWELRIEDWLRQTHAYRAEKLTDYIEFSQDSSGYYKYVLLTLDHRLLFSLPASAAERAQGSSYRITHIDSSLTEVEHYQQGVLANGGYFKTAVARIFRSQKNIIETHYRDVDGSYNDGLQAAILRTEIKSSGDLRETYMDSLQQPVGLDGIFEQYWKYEPGKDSFLATYLDAEGRAIPNNDGAFHQRRYLDALGRSTQIDQLSLEGQLQNDRDGIARYSYTYGEDHLKGSYRLFDQTGKPAYHKNDYHLSYDYDRLGQIIRVRSLDMDGQPIYDNNGASIYEYTYDSSGRETSEKRFNKFHEPVVANDDYFLRVTEYDSLGRTSFQAFYYPDYVLKFDQNLWGATRYEYPNDTTRLEYNIDAYGDVIENDKGISVIERTYDQKENLRMERYLDAEGNLINAGDGVAKYDYEYNEEGNLVVQQARDSLGNLIAFNGSATTIVRAYNGQGQVVRVQYLDGQNQPASGLGGYSEVRYSYESQTGLTETTYYDGQGIPMEVDGVFAEQTYQDSRGNTTSIRRFDTDREPIGGVFETRYTYDRFGYETRRNFLNRNARPVADENGAYAVETLYDRRHYLAGYRFLGSNGRLATNLEGYAAEYYVRDELGHAISHRYVDHRERPVVGPGGYYLLEYEWAPMGEIQKSSTFGTDGKLMEDEQGTAMYEYDLAPCGLRTEVRRYNAAGKLSNNVDGIAITRYAPDLNGLYYLLEEVDALGKVLSEEWVAEENQ